MRVLATLILAIFGLPNFARPQTPARWMSPFLGEFYQGACSASGSSLGNSGGWIGLFIDKTRPDVLVVTFGVYGSVKTDMAATPMAANISFSTGSLTLSGRAVRVGGLPLQFGAGIGGDQARQMIHLLTSAPDAVTATFTGDPSVARVSLAGSSKAIDAMERCVTAHRFAGVVPPFRGVSDAPVETPRHCLAFGYRVTLRGTLIKRTMNIEEGLQDYPELRLDGPVCIDRPDSLSAFQPAVSVMLIEASQGTTFSPPPQAFGRPIEITGTLRAPVSKFDFEPTVLTLARHELQGCW